VPEEVIERLPGSGDADACALAAPMPMVYREIHLLTRPGMRRQGLGSTLPATALVKGLLYRVHALRFPASLGADWNFTRILVRRGLQRQPARPAGRKV
jgi:hypothetical protein